jgi:hypothetical protein
MAKAYVISVVHYQDRETKGVAKDECIVLHFKMSLDVKEQPQMVVLYPKKGVSRDVVEAGFLDEVDLVLGPDPRNISRNVVTDVKVGKVAA